MADSLDEQLRIMREMNRALRNMADATDSQQPDLGRQSKVFRQMFETIRDGFDKFKEIDLGGNGGPVSTLGVRITAFARGMVDRVSGIFDSGMGAMRSGVSRFNVSSLPSPQQFGKFSSALDSGSRRMRSATRRGMGRAAQIWGSLSKGAPGLLKFGARRVPLLGEIASGIFSYFDFKNLSGLLVGVGAVIGTFFTAFAMIIPKILGIVTTVITGLAKIIIGTVVAVISSVASSFSALVEWAMGGGGGGGYRQAMEELRKEFGSFTGQESAAVLSSFRKLGDSFSSVAHTGKSVRRIFGSVADRLKFATEFAKAFGPTFTLFASEVESVGHEMLFLRKGLRLTDEAIKGIAVSSRMGGKSVNQSMMEIATVSINFAESFDIDATKISRNMGEMTADTENFATLGNLVIGKLSVTAIKLGISVKEFTSIIEKYDNYEDAAKSASQLNQAFGMSLDARQLSTAQDPSERLRMMQESFMLSGRTLQELSRAEVNLLAAQTGLSAEGVRLAFSNDGLLMDHDEISRKTPTSLDQLLPKSEVFAKLAKSIDLTVGGGGDRPTGFFDAFIKGFLRGVSRDHDVRELRRNIRAGVKKFELVGRRVGREFARMPSSVTLFGALTGFFDGVTTFVQSLVGPLSSFIENISVDPMSAFNDLYSDVRMSLGLESMDNLIAAASERGVNWGWMSGAAAGLITTLTNLVTDTINSIITFIRELFLQPEGTQQALTQAARENNADPNGMVNQAYNSMRDTFETNFARVREELGSLVNDQFGGVTILGTIRNMFGPAMEEIKRFVNETMIPFLRDIVAPALQTAKWQTIKAAAAPGVASAMAGAGVGFAIAGPKGALVGAAIGGLAPVAKDAWAAFARWTGIDDDAEFSEGTVEIGARNIMREIQRRMHNRDTGATERLQQQSEEAIRDAAAHAGYGSAIELQENALARAETAGFKVRDETVVRVSGAWRMRSPSLRFAEMSREMVLQSSIIKLSEMMHAAPTPDSYEDVISVVSAELAKLPAVTKEMKKLPLATYNAHVSLYKRAVEELQEFRDGLSNMRPIRMNIGLRNFSASGQVDSFSESYSVNGTQVNINATVNTVMRASGLKNLLVDQNVVRAETNGERASREVKQSQMGIRHTGDASGSKRFTVGAYEDTSAVTVVDGEPISSGPETQDYEVTVHS